MRSTKAICLLFLTVCLLLTSILKVPTIRAAAPYQVVFSTRNFGSQVFLYAYPGDLRNPQQATFGLDSAATLWYGIEARSQPSGITPQAADPSNDFVASLLVDNGLLPPAGAIPIELFAEESLLQVSFRGPGQQLQLAINPFNSKALTLDALNIFIEILGDHTSGSQIGVLVPGNLKAIFALVTQMPDLVDFISSYSAALGDVAHNRPDKVSVEAFACAKDLYKIFKVSSELARLTKVLTLLIGPAIGSIAVTLASWASGIAEVITIAELARYLADFMLSLGAYLLQGGLLPTIVLQTVASASPTVPAQQASSPTVTTVPTPPTAGPTVTTVPTPPTPDHTPVISPTPTSAPPTLSVNPASRVNNFQSCSTETHGGSGYLISCPFAVSNSTGTRENLNWSVSANDPRVIFDHSSGILAPGQSITINAEMYGNGNGSLPCPFALSLLFTGSANSMRVPLICSEISTNPDASSFDNTSCSHNGNWVCIITVAAFTQNAVNTPWTASVLNPDPAITFSPAQGVLAPGATAQVTVTIPNSDCPGNNTLYFSVPGGLPNGSNYLGWSC